MIFREQNSSIVSFFSGHPLLNFIFSLMLVSGIHILRYFMQMNLSLSLLYLIPVLGTAWINGRRPALFLVIYSTVSWLGILTAGSGINSLQNISTVNEFSRLFIFILSVYILTSLKKILIREKSIACTDDLSGVFTRRAFRELAEGQLSLAQRRGSPFSMLYIDIDDFKHINDNYGHSTGDEIIAEVGKILSKGIRRSDIPVRLGGDEFGVYFPDLDSSSAEDVISKISVMMKKSEILSRRGVTFSMGMVTFNRDPGGVDKIISLSDREMYRVKTSGKDKVKYRVF